MTKALVVLSGGQDSTTTLLLAREQYGNEGCKAITFDYGQQHRAEIDAAKAIAEYLGVNQFTVQIPGFAGNSPLTTGADPERYESFEQMSKIIGDRIEKTFIPGRNLVFLSIACSVAAGMGFDEVWTGVCQEDNANYPDCRGSFITALQLTVLEAMGHEINGPRIITPLLHLSKAETVAQAMRFGDDGQVALSLSHTCYVGTFPPCGTCHACVLRAEGFRVAGVPDPLILRAQAHVAAT
jgi:7-cyano-7-deazaguanine synthase